MKKKRALIVLAFILLGGLLRFGCVAVGSVGGGRGVESPNKRFLAEASEFTGKKFWGGTYDYYEFTVQTEGGQRIQHVLMDVPPQGMIDWREEGSIQWAPDSASITYSFKGGQLTLSVKPQ